MPTRDHASLLERADRQGAGHIQSSETEIGRQADVERTRATMASRARR